MPQILFPLHQHGGAPQVLSDAGGRPVLEARSVGINDQAISAEEVASQVIQALEKADAWESQFNRACRANLAANRDNGRLHAALLGLRGVMMVCEERLAWIRRELLTAVNQVDQALAPAPAGKIHPGMAPCDPPREASSSDG